MHVAGTVHTSPPPSSELLPIRLNPLQKLGRFFRFGGRSTIDNGEASKRRGTDEPPDLRSSSPGLYNSTTPKSSQEAVKPRRSKSLRRGRRTLHHSISTPSIRPSSSGGPPPLVENDDLSLGTLSQRRKSKPLKPISSPSPNGMGIESYSLTPDSFTFMRKRNAEKISRHSPAVVTPLRRNFTSQDGAFPSDVQNSESTLPITSWHLRRTDSLESSSSLARSTFHMQEAHLRPMPSFGSSVTATNPDDVDLQVIKEEPPALSGISKVCRILGSCPDEINKYTGVAEFGELSPSSSPSLSHKALSVRTRPDSPDVRIKPARRVSLTLSTVASIPARLRPQLHSRRLSASTLAGSVDPGMPANTDGLSGADVPDDASELLHEMRDDSYAAASTHSLVSPIAFNPDPPSPVCPISRKINTIAESISAATLSPTRKGSLTFAFPSPSPSPSTPNPSDFNLPSSGLRSEASATPASAPPLARSRPRSFSQGIPKLASSSWSSRLFSSAHGRGSTPNPEHAGRAAVHRPTQSTFDSSQFAALPVRAGWLEGPVHSTFARNTERAPERDMGAGRTTVTTGKASVVEWSAGWNEEDMQHVINKLRKLR